jgi:nucleoside 2-deoxyribosyltransferase
MRKMKVYLSGPIMGRPDNFDSVGWRRICHLHRGEKYEFLDPLDRADMRGRNPHAEQMKDIILADREDIWKSDVVVVYYDGNASVGAAMEQFFAYESGKHVILWINDLRFVEMEDLRHYSIWLRYHSHKIVRLQHEVDEALDEYHKIWKQDQEFDG